jgi:hypothetical protein
MIRWRVQSACVPGWYLDTNASSMFKALKDGAEGLAIKLREQQQAACGKKKLPALTSFQVSIEKLADLKTEFYITKREAAGTEWIEMKELGTFTNYKAAHKVAEQQKEPNGNASHTWVKSRYIPKK